MFVVTITYTQPIEQIEAATADHRAWLAPHVESGLMIAVGPMVPRTGGILLARGGGSRDDLMTLLADDPFQARGLARYDVVEFNPIKHHPALTGIL